ncbi:nucleoside phosphorylase domain-containing protein [Aspergillus crustosus]
MSHPRPTQADSSFTTSYTVALITSLHEEYTSASYMLDEEFNSPFLNPNSDTNFYNFGRIGDHYVVITCLPPGRFGSISTCRAAVNMLRTFSNLRFALLIGIGGGAPSREHDIRLGDVVVSEPDLADGLSGVVKYDMGKRVQGGLFERIGNLDPPPRVLCEAVEEVKKKRGGDSIQRHVVRMDGMDEYQRPRSTDLLFQAEYRHVPGEEDCGLCDRARVVKRPERRTRDFAVHYGTIASGDSVMKDAITRELYARDPETKVLCFEMEAAGLMNSIPSLVIRGISDYCDSHKNDDWRRYAALTAAAYARELLLHVHVEPRQAQIYPEISYVAPADFSQGSNGPGHGHYWASAGDSQTENFVVIEDEKSAMVYSQSFSSDTEMEYDEGEVRPVEERRFYRRFWAMLRRRARVLTGCFC